MTGDLRNKRKRDGQTDRRKSPSAKSSKKAEELSRAHLPGLWGVGGYSVGRPHRSHSIEPGALFPSITNYQLGETTWHLSGTHSVFPLGVGEGLGKKTD